VVNDSGLGEARREERVLQLLRLLNLFLGKKKETSRRFLHITVPRVVAVSPQMRLVEDNPASLSLMSIFKQKLASKGLDPDSPIAHYYDKLKAIQSQGQQANHQIFLNLMREIQNTMASPELLKEWALNSFPQATEYWTFRKMVQPCLFFKAIHSNPLYFSSPDKFTSTKTLASSTWPTSSLTSTTSTASSKQSGRCPSD
jgi:transformation/transcription domain-associated protein